MENKQTQPAREQSVIDCPHCGSDCNERDELQKAEREVDRLRTENEELRKELEIERCRLAGCGVAALGYFKGCIDEYKSASLDDVLRLHAEVEELRSILGLALKYFEDRQQRYKNRFPEWVQDDLAAM